MTQELVGTLYKHTMKKLHIILTLGFSLSGISLNAQQVEVDKQVAIESIQSLVPKHIRNALDQVNSKEPNEEGKVKVSQATLKLVKAGAKRINKLDQIQEAETEAKANNTKTKAFEELGEGKLSGLPKELRQKYKSLSKIEKQIILEFFKKEELPIPKPEPEQ